MGWRGREDEASATRSSTLLHITELVLPPKIRTVVRGPYLNDVSRLAVWSRSESELVTQRAWQNITTLEATPNERIERASFWFAIRSCTHQTGQQCQQLCDGGGSRRKGCCIQCVAMPRRSLVSTITTSIDSTSSLKNPGQILARKSRETERKEKHELQANDPAGNKFSGPARRVASVRVSRVAVEGLEQTSKKQRF